ncbi:MAG: NADH-quinone oxidoreductase subunit NuoN [Actinobacteria bacterium]|nr:NADH-quinone oxidoreductase subunit NuoN [Actinomycetota bacterium]
MEFEAPAVQLGAIGPEIALVTTALLLLIVDAFIPEGEERWYLAVLATIGFGVAIILAANQWGERELQLARMVAVDNFATFVKTSVAVFAVLTVWLSRDYLKRSEDEESEFYALLLFAAAGMMLMASAADLIMVFLALEIFSISLYVLVGFRRRSLASQESAMKYFLLGAFSSAFFLMGIALVYGATGTTNFYPGGGGEGIAGYLVSSAASDVDLLVLGVGLLIVGLGFKIAAVPFHMWTPDAYQGAPSPITGFMAAGTKFAAVATMLRLFVVVLYPLRADWRPILIAVAIATMLLGSVLAVIQEDVKRLLAYSSIAHAGFVLTGLIAANDRGLSGSLFYLATYGLTVLGAFAVVTVLAGRKERNVTLASYRGLFYERPLLAGALTLFMLSLAGVPLTSGFVGKFLVFGAAIQAGYWWLAVIGMLASVIATFFYLRVLVVMYMQEDDRGLQPAITGRLANSVVGLTAAATLVLGIVWGPLIDLAERATVFFA